jgi:hypothetical protein
MYAKKGLFKTFEEMDGTEEYQIIGFLEVLIGDEKRYEPLYERVGEVSCKTNLQSVIQNEKDMKRILDIQSTFPYYSLRIKSCCFSKKGRDK